jgi:hypothetical protein
VVDDAVGAHRQRPLAGLRPRHTRQHRQAGTRLGELGHDRTDAARPGHHEQRPVGVLRQAEAVEQRLPRRDGCQGQRGGLCPVQRRRLPADDALVDELVLSVAAVARDVAGPPDLVALGEGRDVGAGLDHGARAVEAEDLGLGARAQPAADFDVDRVDGHRLDLDQHVPRAGFTDLQLLVEEALRVGDRQAAVGDDRSVPHVRPNPNGSEHLPDGASRVASLHSDFSRRVAR